MYTLQFLRNFIDVGSWSVLVAPFVIWALGEILLVGFFFPLLKALRDRKESREGARIEWKHTFILGFRRVINYKWEIFFSSVGGIVIMDIYWVCINLADEFLPSFLYVMITFISTFLLCILLFSKGNGIMSNPPSSSLKCLKFIWGGFMNPFDKTEVSRMRDTVVKVNKGIMESSSSR